MNVPGPFLHMLCQSIQARRVSGSGQLTLRKVMGQGKKKNIETSNKNIL